MPSKKKEAPNEKVKNKVSARSKNTGHSIYIKESEYQELLKEIPKLDSTDNEAIFKGQLHALIMNKFKGRFSLKQVTDKNYKQLKGKWVPKK